MLLHSVLPENNWLGKKVRASLLRSLCAYVDDESCVGKTQQWMVKRKTHGGLLKFDQPQGLMKTGKIINILSCLTKLFRHHVHFVRGQTFYNDLLLIR